MRESISWAIATVGSVIAIYQSLGMQEVQTNEDKLIAAYERLLEGCER